MATLSIRKTGFVACASKYKYATIQTLQKFNNAQQYKRATPMKPNSNSTAGTKNETAFIINFALQLARKITPL